MFGYDYMYYHKVGMATYFWLIHSIGSCKPNSTIQGYTFHSKNFTTNMIKAFKDLPHHTSRLQIFY